MIKFDYSKHARYRMRRRGVSQIEVETTVLHPESWYYGSEGEINAIKKFGRKTVRVVYESLPQHIRVITVIKE
ncbi:MAG: DUF4258 domain-containing protein [bacterium]